MSTNEKDLIVRSNSSDPTYKEYKYPDGRILMLTKSEFYDIVDLFRFMRNDKRKKEGRPLPKGGPDQA